MRRRLDDERASLTHEFSVGGNKGYVIVGLYPDGRPGEVFIRMDKSGSTLGSLFDQGAIAVSIGLQTGVPLATFTEKFKHVRFEPQGLTSSRDIPFAASPIDYVARWLEMKFGEEARSDDNKSERLGTDALFDCGRGDDEGSSVDGEEGGPDESSMVEEEVRCA